MVSRFGFSTFRMKRPARKWSWKARSIYWGSTKACHSTKNASKTSQWTWTSSFSTGDRFSTTGSRVVRKLVDVVRNVLIHEVGHHFGLSDEAMEALESEAGG